MTPQALLAAFLIVLSATAPAWAQQTARREVDAAVDARLGQLWTKFLAEEARDAGVTLANRRLTGSRDAKTAVYGKVLDRISADVELLEFFTPAYIRAMIDEQVESRVPTSVNGTSTNPATAGLFERSGSTSLMALAADLASLAGSDKTAVSINLSGLALISLSDPTVYSAIKSYQEHGFARRFSGTFVFGAQIPEHEITGFSAVPDFAKLLDAFGWDVKARIWGDKDPRSARWSNETVRGGGLLTQKSAVLLSLVGTTPLAGETPAEALEDAQILQSLLAKRLGEGVAAIKSRIAKAPQLSVKVAGTHLTKETGRNKYAAAFLFDIGIGPSDLTLNAQYALTDDIRFGADRLFQTKIVTLAGGLTTHLAPNAIVSGRTLDWSVGGSVNVFTDTSSLPVPADNTWKIFTSVEVPVRGGGKIPVSIIYSNDPNSLTKEKYVRGQIGLSYDFSALKQLFSPGS